jgi:hypothetical protein
MQISNQDGVQQNWVRPKKEGYNGRGLQEKQNAVLDKRQKLEDKPITTSRLTKEINCLKVSSIALSSTTGKPHLRALMYMKQIETKIMLDDVKVSEVDERRIQ